MKGMGTEEPTRIIGLSGNLAFGDVITNTTAQRTLTICNSGKAALTVRSISYPTGVSGNWSGGSIPAGSSNAVTVTFAPMAVASYDGVITVNSDATGGGNTISASGKGTAVPTRIIGLSGNLAFGDVITNTTAQRTLTIANSGNAALSVSGMSYPTGFSGNWAGGSIPAGSSNAVTVTFAPMAVASYDGVITVDSDATGGGNTINASGKGTEGPTRLIGLSGNIDFGDVITSTTAQRTLTIANSGNAALTVSGITYPTCFSGNWAGGSIPAGSSNAVTVTFAPTAVMGYGGVIMVNSDATGGANIIRASGNGVIELFISTPCPLPDGTVAVAYSQTFTAVGATTPYTWTISSGALPPGLELDRTSGVVSGTPTMADSYSFTVRCTAADNQYAEKQCHVTVTASATPKNTMPLVLDSTPGAAWNGYTGWVGMQLRVGAAPLEVWELGRVFIDGNAKNHVLRLVRASDGAVMASATWTPAGGLHNEIKYATLSAPVTLTPNTQYYLASQEEAGGDAWYNQNTTVRTAGGALVQAPAYSKDGTHWVAHGTSGPFSYGPVSLGYRCSGTPLVQDFTPGASWNHYSGWVGMRLRVGEQPIEVWELGRVFIEGNTRSHELRLVRVSDRTVVASAAWTPTGGVHNQMKYVALAAPVTLASNTHYYLASQEEAEGDSWYNQDTTVTTTGGAVVQAPVYSRDGRSWVAQGSGGSYSYGPVSLGYCAMAGQETALVTGFTAGDSWNTYSGWVGMQLQVGASPLEVTSLGRVFVTGNRANHALRLVRMSDRAVVASATWTASGGVHSQIKYVALAAPVTLAPNTQYYLASQEEAGGDHWYNHETTVTTSGGAVVQARVYSRDGSSWVAYGTSGAYSYGPVSLGYSALPCTETALVQDFRPGESWNHYSGWVGMRLQVGANPLQVWELGRVFIEGNTQDHELRLVRVSDRTVVASATWTPTNGVHNLIKYVALAAPVTLEPNTQYCLASQEEAEGDSWYNQDTTVTTTAGAVVQAPVYSRDGRSWVAQGSGGSYSYGPLSLGFCAMAGQETPLVTGFTPGAIPGTRTADGSECSCRWGPARWRSRRWAVSSWTGNRAEPHVAIGANVG